MLPFVPLNDVEEVFDLILENVNTDEETVVQDLQDLVNYVDATYITGVPARGRRRAVPPRFEPGLWNVYDMVVNRLHRSTNVVEGWHSRFQRIIISHPSRIWKFLDNIRKDQNENEIIQIQLDAGHTRVRHQVKGTYKKKSRSN